MLTLAMPQSLPDRGDEALGLAQIGGEDARGEALRHGVVQRDAPRRARDSASRRGSARRSRGSTISLCRGISTMRGTDVDRRRAKLSASTRSPPVHRAALRLRLRRARAAWPRRRACRSAGRPACPARADCRSASLRIGVLQPRRRACRRRCSCTMRRRSVVQRWPGGADGGEQDRAHGEIEIGRRRDDHARCCRRARGWRGRSARRRAAPPRGPCASSRWR